MRVHEVAADRAADVLAVIRAGFEERPPLTPPTAALAETEETLAKALADGGGLLALVEDRPVGTLLFHAQGGQLWLLRVAVVPDVRDLGVAGALVGTAEALAARRGYVGLRIDARAELPETHGLWRLLGYDVVAQDGTCLTFGKELPVEVTAESAETAQDLGRRLAGLLRAGDLVLLSGDLGAGKTTFTQGLGEGLGVRGPVTSPTFVIARVHPSVSGGPALVHADAYRLGGIEELDDLDLDASLEEAVTVVEWGEGVAEGLTETRLEVAITRARGEDSGEPSGEDHDPRHLRVTPVGARWIGAGLRDTLA